MSISREALKNLLTLSTQGNYVCPVEGCRKKFLSLREKKQHIRVAHSRSH